MTKKMEWNRMGNCLDIRCDVGPTFDRRRTHYIEIYSHANLETIN